MSKNIEEGELRLADLGYYKASYLAEIDEKKAFFVSKLKSTLAVYKKNPNPKTTKKGKVYKNSEYIRIDILELIKTLAIGQTIEFKDIFIGPKKELKSRLIITKLSEENKKKRIEKQKKAIKREKRSYNKRIDEWSQINTYITNIPEETLSAHEIHEIYSLRWQIEIMFKIWKSVFKISNVKAVKIQRFKCFLYGRLISILFVSGIVFSSKKIIKDEYMKELSELKAFKQVNEFLFNFRTKIFEGEIMISNLIKEIITILQRLAIKSIRKDRKKVHEILNYLINKAN